MTTCDASIGRPTMEPSHPQSSTNRQLREAADAVLSRSGVPPRVVIILGTGLGGLADRVANPTHVPYAEIPHFPTATVVGHAGRLVLGELRCAGGRDAGPLSSL